MTKLCSNILVGWICQYVTMGGIKIIYVLDAVLILFEYCCCQLNFGCKRAFLLFNVVKLLNCYYYLFFFQWCRMWEADLQKVAKKTTQVYIH